MALGPFTWGMGGQKITSPEQAARQRAVAEALIGQSATPASNWAGGLADVAAALSGTVLQGRVDEAEAAGRARAGGLFADLAVNADPNSIIAALTSPDAAWASPAQTSIASALLNSGLERQDPMYQLQLEQAQLDLDRARNPVAEPFTLGEGQIRYGGDGSIIAQGLPSSPLVSVNTGDTNDFYKGLDTEAGKQIPAAIEAGRNAVSNNIRLGQLETLLGPQGTAPQGAQGALVQAAAGLGIPLEGADDVQAAQALINQMVPGQRPPGSGTMSDQDLALFKASLPSIVNQPGGNQKIIQTTKAINEYIAEQGRIAEMVANRQITREEGAMMQAAVPNPLAGGGATIPATGAVEEGYRFKGGNPADPNSWEKVN